MLPHEKEFLKNTTFHMEDSSLSKAYQATFAGGKSGLSFGKLQLDVASKNKTATNAFEAVLTESGLFTGDRIKQIAKDAAKQGAEASNFTTSELANINKALNSPEG